MDKYEAFYKHVTTGSEEINISLTNFEAILIKEIQMQGRETRSSIELIAAVHLLIFIIVSLYTILTLLF